MIRADYDRFTDDLVARLRVDDRVIGLVALGSMAATDRAPDEWSDHDFWVVTVDGAADAVRSETGWLPRADDVVIAFTETAHGRSVITLTTRRALIGSDCSLPRSRSASAVTVEENCSRQTNSSEVAPHGPWRACSLRSSPPTSTGASTVSIRLVASNRPIPRSHATSTTPWTHRRWRAPSRCCRSLTVNSRDGSPPSLPPRWQPSKQHSIEPGRRNRDEADRLTASPSYPSSGTTSAPPRAQAGRR